VPSFIALFARTPSVASSPSPRRRQRPGENDGGAVSRLERSVSRGVAGSRRLPSAGRGVSIDAARPRDIDAARPRDLLAGVVQLLEVDKSAQVVNLGAERTKRRTS
jgi:hypothetical protein